MSKSNNPRDLVGYGRTPPNPQWPGNARLAINFVVNYEEGAERSPLLGDESAETYGGEFSLLPRPAGMRNLSMESLFEYGSRAGFWRLMRLFDDRKVNTTIFAAGLALQENPEICNYLAQSDHDVAGHGWRWIDYCTMPVEAEREHIHRTVSLITDEIGRRPVGWYTGRRSENTREILVELGGFLYDSESYADDVPYFVDIKGHKHLVIPYNLDCNDFRFVTSPAFSHSDDFCRHLKDSFDLLRLEGEAAPKMMSVGLHGRIGGRPARAAALKRFLDYVIDFDDVWICTREEIARHWFNLFSPVK